MGVSGEWQSDNASLRFLGKAQSLLPADADQFVIGIAASNIERFTEGEIEVTVQFADVTTPQHTAGIILAVATHRNRRGGVVVGVERSGEARLDLRPRVGGTSGCHFAMNELRERRRRGKRAHHLDTVDQAIAVAAVP